MAVLEGFLGVQGVWKGLLYGLIGIAFWASGLAVAEFIRRRLMSGN